MTQQSRRRFVAGMGAALAASGMSVAVRAAMGPQDKFDLLIKGGEVFDPSQSLRAKRDIGMRFGKIEALSEQSRIEIAARKSLAKKVIDGLPNGYDQMVGKRFDGGVDLLLMIEAEPGDGLLQKIHIALQAAGAALHGLFDRADFNAGNVLRRPACG